MSCCQHQITAVASCPQCEFEAFVRNHFFTGKMMGAPEFRTETHFHAEKMRHHNARLHGAGVVCGLKAKQHPSPDCRKRYVVVEPGSALDCCGHEILVPHEEIVDVAGLPQVKALARDAELHTLQVCVRFRECPTEEVPLLYDECGCDDTKCAPNKILESYAFEVLVDPPLHSALLTGAAPAGAFVATNVHGVRGSFAAAGGRAVIVDPANARRLFFFDLAHRSVQTVVLAVDTRALALSDDGAFVYVLTNPSAVGGACEVLVYTVADAQPVDPVVAGTLRTVPASTAGSTLLAATQSVNARKLLTYERPTGEVHLWAEHNATHPIKDAPAAPPLALGAAANWSALAVLPTGTKAYGIDGAGAVQELTLTTGAVVPVALAAGATPVALALAEVAGTRYLAVASDANRSLYVIDLGTGLTAATIALAHEPVYVAATDSWIHVYEEEAGHAYVQAVSLAPLPAGAPLVTAARLAGVGPQQLVLLYADGRAARLDVAGFAEGDCSDHLWKQLGGCAECDLPDCIVLASIGNYRPGFDLLDLPAAANDIAQLRARIDNRAGRRMLASTATLQAWIECLQLHGGVPGPAGPAGTNGSNGTNGTNGVGLNLNLPKIVDIAWAHGGGVNLEFLRLMYSGIASLDDARQRVQSNLNVPLFTLYFNRRVTTDPRWWRQVFTLHVDAPLALPIGPSPPGGQGNTLQSPGFYWPLNFQLLGDIIEIDPGAGPLLTPHTNEVAARAVTFVLRREFFQRGPRQLAIGYYYLWFAGVLARVANLQNPAQDAVHNLEQPSIRIRFNGQFVGETDNGLATGRITQDGVLDGDNVGGRVGQNEVRGGPILGGRNPSGNMTQGGVFESWISVLTPDDYGLPDLTTGAHATIMNNAIRGVAALEPPPSANLVNEADLRALNVPAAVTRRVLAERERGPFLGVADLRRRVSDRDFDAITSRLVVL